MTDGAGRGFDLKGWLVAAAVAVVAYVGLTSLTPSGPNGGPPATPDPTGAPQPEGPRAARRSLGVGLRQVDDGLKIERVLRGGSAEAAGLVAGDVILEVDGRALARGPEGEDRTERLLEHLDRAGAALTLRVRRGFDEGVEEVRVSFLGEGSFERGLADQLVADAAAQLIAERRADGWWPDYLDREDPSVAVTALAAYALSRAGEGEEVRAARDDAIAKLLERRAEDGGLADPVQRFAHRTYANALLLLAVADDPARAGLREELAAWLTGAQFQEESGFDVYDRHHGGWSYHDTFDRDIRADISTLRFAVQALAAAGLAPDHPAWTRVRLYLDLAHNQTRITAPDDPLHAREAGLRDGGFAFAPRMSKAGSQRVGRTLLVYRSYGSATADGLLALLALDGADHRGHAEARLPVTQERPLAALGWLARHYTLEENPGFPAQVSVWRRGIHLYYLAALAQGLHRAGVWRVVGREGPPHVWAAELVRLLANLHEAQGGRFEGVARAMHEDDPTLAAAFALLALDAARDRLAVGGGATLEAGDAPPLIPQDLEASPPPADAVGRGRALFQERLGCAGCHRDDGAGTGPSLVGIGERYLGRYRSQAVAGDRLRRHLRDPQGTPGLLVGAWDAQMPPAPVEDEEQMADLVAFLLSRVGERPVSGTR